MNQIRATLRVLLFALFLSPSLGQASGPALVETMFGLNQMIGGQPYFNTAPSVTGFGISASGVLAYNFGWRTKKPVWVHAGIWGQLDLLSGETASYTLAGIYPFLRLHIKRVFITGGATPFLWKSEGEGGLTTIEAVSTAFGILGQIGYDWEITPEVSMLFAIQNQSILTSRGVSPSLLYAATLGFRFYLYPDSSFQSRRRYYGEDEDPYPGWRYPYGSPMR